MQTAKILTNQPQKNNLIKLLHDKDFSVSQDSTYGDLIFIAFPIKKYWILNSGLFDICAGEEVSYEELIKEIESHANN